jgi:hypothetical protein
MKLLSRFQMGHVRRFQSHRLGMFCLCIFFAFLTSCVSEPSPFNVSGASRFSLSMLKLIEKRNSSIRSFAAQGEITIQTKGKEYRGRQTIAASVAPNSFVLQVSTPANSPILSVSAFDEIATIIDYQNSSYSDSPIDKGSFKLSPTEWLRVDYFTLIPVGNVPLVAKPVITDEFDDKKNEVLITLNEKGLSESIMRIRADTDPPYLIKDLQSSFLGSTEYFVSFRQYREYGDFFLPEVIHIEMPLKQMTITIKHRNIIVNPPITYDQFMIQPPLYFRKIDL